MADYLNSLIFFFLLSLRAAAIDEARPPNNRSNDTGIVASGDTIFACPTWYLPAPNSSQSSCQCGDEFDGYLRCTPDKEKVSVLSCYCVTLDQTEESVVMTNCLYTCQLVYGNEYRELPSDPRKLDEEVCSPFHRKGPHCSHCVEGYAISSFSSHAACVECPRSMWLEYMAITILPLTIFYFAALFFRFHATSAWLDSYILFSQIVSSPSTSRLLLYRASVIGNHNATLTEVLSYPVSYLSGVLQTGYGIWNLNFFQFLVPPFCLDPNWSIIQVIALDYLTAFYPLVLVALNYLIIILYTHNFKPLVVIWKPLSKLAIRFRNNIAISRNSVIHSFATFILLSYVKVIYVSADLLHVSMVRLPTGQYRPLVWNYNASVPYFGTEHIGYGLFALFAIIFAVILPFLFLALYPCKCFHKLFPWVYSKPQISAFVECFQGHYKDGTCGSRDFRFISAVFLGIRMVSVVVSEYVISGYAIPLGSMVLTTFGTVILVAQPYKKLIHNRVNGVLLIVMSMWMMSQTFYHFPFNNVGYYHVIAVIVDFSLCTLPFCYFMVLVFCLVWGRAKSLECMKRNVKSMRGFWNKREKGAMEEDEHTSMEAISTRFSLPDRVVNPRDYNVTSCLSTITATNPL